MTVRLLITDSEATTKSGLRVLGLLVHVPEDVRVTVVGAKKTPLPPALRARTDFRRLGTKDNLVSVIEETALGATRVVVVDASGKLGGDWWSVLGAEVARQPRHALYVGEPTPTVMSFPGGLRALEAPETTLASLPGVLSSGAAAPRVTFGAVMIVKDEERVLGKSLEALQRFVDEVVVYDTGSSDRTVAIAEEAGARVVRGHWNDHFGDARNRALEHCTTDWALQIDADEVIHGDAAAARRRLAGAVEDVALIQLQSPTHEGGASADVFYARRVFRRSRVRWSGALHERLVDAATGSQDLQQIEGPLPLGVIHSGYQTATVSEKNKVDRNLKAAKQGVETAAPGDELDVARAQYGRALTDMGRHAEALEVFALVSTSSVPETVCHAAYPAISAALSVRDLPLAQEWIDRLVAAGEKEGRLAFYRARVSEAQGRTEEALQLLRSVTRDFDLFGRLVDPELARVDAVRLLGQHGRTAEAWAELVLLLPTAGSAVKLDLVLACARIEGVDAAEVCRLAGESFLESSLREVLHLPPTEADTWLHALDASGRLGGRAVVAGSANAARLSVLSALPWSLRTIEAGLSEFCPLRRLVADEERPLLDRAVAGVVLADVLADGNYAGTRSELEGRMSARDRADLDRSLARLLGPQPVG